MFPQHKRTALGPGGGLPHHEARVANSSDALAVIASPSEPPLARGQHPAQWSPCLASGLGAKRKRPSTDVGVGQPARRTLLQEPGAPRSPRAQLEQMDGRGPDTPKTQQTEGFSGNFADFDFGDCVRPSASPRLAASPACVPASPPMPHHRAASPASPPPRQLSRSPRKRHTGGPPLAAIGAHPGPGRALSAAASPPRGFASSRRLGARAPPPRLLAAPADRSAERSPSPRSPYGPPPIEGGFPTSRGLPRGRRPEPPSLRSRRGRPSTPLATPNRLPAAADRVHLGREPEAGAVAEAGARRRQGKARGTLPRGLHLRRVQPRGRCMCASQAGHGTRMDPWWMEMLLYATIYNGKHIYILAMSRG